MGIIDNFAEFVPRESDSVIVRYTEAHDLEFDTYDTDLSDVIDAHQVNNAEGEELDRLGALFGELGDRAGRTDSEYKAYLTSVIDSFNGRGTLTGLKFAVASSIDADTSNVKVVEDFQNLSYEIQIVDFDDAFAAEPINDLAELADPSVVELTEAIIILEGEDIIISEGTSSVTSSDSGLGSGTLTLDGNSNLQ